ncbi:hypothetical protein VTO42DRAFT_167 [Malbranchea cinnamomea]
MDRTLATYITSVACCQHWAKRSFFIHEHDRKLLLQRSEQVDELQSGEHGAVLDGHEPTILMPLMPQWSSALCRKVSTHFPMSPFSMKYSNSKLQTLAVESTLSSFRCRTVFIVILPGHSRKN